MTRRGLLRSLMTGTLAVLTSALWLKPSGSLLRTERVPSEIVVHRGWVFRRTDLRHDVRVTPVGSDDL